MSHDRNKLPIYPTFRVLNLSSYYTLNKYIKDYECYSDCSFLSLYAWNTDRKTMYSFLNENLVIKLSDYTTNKTNCILLGTNNVKNTLDILYKKRNKLVLLPEPIVTSIEKDFPINFTLEEDRDNFDYVYSTKLLSEMSGKNFKSLRQNVNNFYKTHHPEVKVIDINNKETQKQILANVQIWKETKSSNYNHKEALAIKRLFKYGINSQFINIGIFVEGNLIGFSINEILNATTALGHFGKYNPNFKGVSKYIEYITSKMLFEKGISDLNLEQDLGLEGLRKAKESLRPIKMQKKFTLYNFTKK